MPGTNHGHGATEERQTNIRNNVYKELKKFNLNCTDVKTEQQRSNFEIIPNYAAILDVKCVHCLLFGLMNY